MRGSSGTQRAARGSCDEHLKALLLGRAVCTRTTQALLLYLGYPGCGGVDNLLHLLACFLQDLQRLARLDLLHLHDRCRDTDWSGCSKQSHSVIGCIRTMVLSGLELGQALLYSSTASGDALLSARSPFHQWTSLLLILNRWRGSTVQPSRRHRSPSQQLRASSMSRGDADGLSVGDRSLALY